MAISNRQPVTRWLTRPAAIQTIRDRRTRGPPFEATASMPLMPSREIGALRDSTESNHLSSTAMPPCATVAAPAASLASLSELASKQQRRLRPRRAMPPPISRRTSRRSSLALSSSPSSSASRESQSHPKPTPNGFQRGAQSKKGCPRRPQREANHADHRHPCRQRQRQEGRDANGAGPLGRR